MSSGSGFFGGWLTIISFHLEKSFGIIKDNCAHVKARLGDGSRLLYPINNMCILRFGLPHSWEPSFPLSRDIPVTYRNGRHGPAHGCPCLSSSCPHCSGAAAEYADYCLFWHFFWKELLRNVRYTGSSTYSFLNLELNILCLFFSPWIMSAP